MTRSICLIGNRDTPSLVIICDVPTSTKLGSIPPFPSLKKEQDACNLVVNSLKVLFCAVVFLFKFSFSHLKTRSNKIMVSTLCHFCISQGVE